MVSHALMESCFICFTDYMVSHAFMVFFISFTDKNHGTDLAQIFMEQTSSHVVFITYKNKFIKADCRCTYGSITYVACENVFIQDASSI